jgi:HEAT repeat protein
MRDLSRLIELLSGVDVGQRATAAEELARLGPGAQPAAPALVRACGDTAEDVRQWATAALEELGPPAAADVGELAVLLESPHADGGYWAATLLGRLGARGAAAVPALAKTLAGTRDLAVRQRAAWALGQMGPAAAGGLGALEACSTEADARLARLAREAIAQIRG